MSPTNKRLRHEPVACPAIREVLNRVGDNWSVQIVAHLGEGSMRFSELRRAIEGITGVNRGSVRVATESGSFCVAFNPQRLPPGKLLAALDRELAPLGVLTTLLRIGDPASLSATVAKAPAPPSP